MNIFSKTDAISSIGIDLANIFGINLGTIIYIGQFYEKPLNYFITTSKFFG